MTEQHECDWEFVVPYYKGAEKVFIVCRHTHCKMVLTKEMAVAMLNEYERLKNALESTNLIAEYALDSRDKFTDLFEEMRSENETLKKATETLSAENRTLEENITSLLRHGSFMEYRGRCEQFLYYRLCDSKWLWENDEPSEHKETCLYLLRANILEGKDDRAT